MAKKTYIPDLQESIDDEIASLAEQRATAEKSAPQEQVAPTPPPAPGVVPRSPAPYAQAPGAAPGPAPMQPAAFPPRSPLPARKRSRTLWRLLLGFLGVVIVLGLVLLVAVLTFHGGATPASEFTPTPGGQPTATPTPAPPTPISSVPGALIALFIIAIIIVLLAVVAVPLIARSRRPAGKRTTGKEVASTDSIQTDLNLQIQRLQQLRTWVNEDPAFSQLVDNIIGKQVKSSERRQQIFSILLGVASLVAGWLLSAFTPPITHLLGH